jgi:anhydro-N-acetylmuramic acid kinase
MNQLKFNVLGLMSGTSLDGLDLCFCTFRFHQEKWQFDLLFSETRSYCAEWKTNLAEAHLLKAEELRQLDAAYGEFLAECICDFIEKNKLDQIDFIGSHGHTILHQPANKITLQIGNGPEIFIKTGIPLICDFRIQDVLLGGQGAPLVPIGDELLFENYAACLNLGGFANISMKQNKERIAFDICAVNIVLNELCKTLGYAYDDGGDFARSGKLIPALFNSLNNIAFFRELPPKSLGREWVETNILTKTTPELDQIDVLHTFTEHAALQIASILKPITGDVLVTGGGAFNRYLIERINQISKHKLILPSDDIINFKEAIVFAFLAVLRFTNQINCLSSVTGARINHSSGRIYK